MFQAIGTAIQTFMDAGAAVFLPVMMLIVALIFRMKLSDAIRAGLYTGIGFIGLQLVINYMMQCISPATTYYQNFGSGFTVTDVPWPAVAGAMWGNPFAIPGVLLLIVINVVLIKLKVTKVLNIDIWNFGHFLIPGALVYVLWGSWVAGLLTSLVLGVLTLLVAEKVAPKWQEYFGLEGTTCSTLYYVIMCWGLGSAINWVLDKIPGVNKINLNIKNVSQKLGIFSEPAIIGLIVGALLAIITKQDVMTVITMSIGIAASMVLMPRMVTIFMEGMSAISNQAQSWAAKKLGNEQDLIIGIDVALGIGDSCAMTTTIICIPIAIGLAFIVPGCNFFPIGILTGICYVSAFASMVSKGNLFRSVIITSLIFAWVIFACSYVADTATLALRTFGADLPGTVTGDVFSDWTEVLITFIYNITH